ncbi:NADPH-dependent FMN reductase [Paracoccus sp. (in: a-proteobacteria)]|uniref:NADPH-dependent FMN reductase n=1 Tax=Paracoccus sp. TaxID=267 RepID=UPI0026E079BE|nr:NAD(P)H-dependent oxidoreductase [Paracoccus sp. (in: a-proteobacteria)]MDO5647930.1 NAD(P)H-dependent oxidoreductase [Paracoccus sp. (in: a-proteobacteria)]
MSKPRIAVIIGSTRDTRFADKPTDWLMEQVQDHADLDFERVDLRDADLPFFNEPASNLWMESSDPRAVAWQKKLAEFDGFFFIVQEYNRSITGALKNALDQAYKEWNRKPMAALAYGSMGGARALEQLRLMAIELQMVPLRNAVHIGGSDFFKVSPLGDDKPMAEIEGNLKGSLDSTLKELTFWAKLLQDAPRD